MLIAKSLGFISVSVAICVAMPALAAPDAGTAPVGATCFLAPAAASSSDISAFLANPSALLTDYPNGGLELSAKVRGLAGTTLDTVAPLLALSSNATATQRAAIGAGLARAARACVATNPTYAATIQQLVAASNQSDLVTAFLAASSDVQTASLGAGGAAGGAAGAGGGGISAGATGNGGSGGATGDVATPTTAETFSFGGGGQFFRSQTTQVSGN